MTKLNGGSATRRRAATMLAVVSFLGAVGIGRADAQLVLPIGGQSSGVENSGAAQANTGGNTSAGNSSTNTADSNSALGGLLNVNLGLGGPSANSTGSSNVTTGPASAAGNQSSTGIDQTSAGAARLGGGQSSGVTNQGAAEANTGGNSSVGNNSRNRATQQVGATGGLIGGNVTLGAPTANSSGTSNITTGAADAAGNVADTTVSQTSAGGHVVHAKGGGGHGVTFVPGVGFVPIAAHGGGCGLGGQHSGVSNIGEASANTGGNTSVGNNSTNVAEQTQTISGGLVGLGITLGGPSANSTGESTIRTGPATAVGNQSTTAVDQTCVGLVPVVATGGHHHVTRVHTVTAAKARSLARTGVEAPDLALMAAALLFGGGMMAVPARRRRLSASTVPSGEGPVTG